MKIFGERLKELRREHDITQRQLAEKLNVSGNTVYAWEQDKQEPSMSTLLAIAGFFGVSLDFLFGRNDY